MSDITDTIISLLSSLNVTESEAKIYLALVEGRGHTALALSRTTGIARTRTYRLLTRLVASKLVVTRVGSRGQEYVATPPEQLDSLLLDAEHALASLKQTLPQLQDSLRHLGQQGSKSSQVLYYQGLEGLKQVTYNSLRAKGELLTYEIGNLDSFLTHSEAEQLRHRFVANKIHTRTLTNQVEIAAWTDVVAMVSTYWQIRHLSPTAAPFQFEILIYNDVYCMYRYHKPDVFCVEIHSQELADMQRQLFEYLWAGARQFKVLDEKGSAQVI